MRQKGFNPVEFERGVNSLRDCQKLVMQERQAQLAPGTKFGRLGGNRALNNDDFVEQTYESGNSTCQVKIG